MPTFITSAGSFRDPGPSNFRFSSSDVCGVTFGTYRNCSYLRGRPTKRADTFASVYAHIVFPPFLSVSPLCSTPCTLSSPSRASGGTISATLPTMLSIARYNQRTIISWPKRISECVGSSHGRTLDDHGKWRRYVILGS